MVISGHVKGEMKRNTEHVVWISWCEFAMRRYWNDVFGHTNTRTQLIVVQWHYLARDDHLAKVSKIVWFLCTVVAQFFLSQFEVRTSSYTTPPDVFNILLNFIEVKFSECVLYMRSLNVLEKCPSRRLAFDDIYRMKDESMAEISYSHVNTKKKKDTSCCECFQHNLWIAYSTRDRILSSHFLLCFLCEMENPMTIILG